MSGRQSELGNQAWACSAMLLLIKLICTLIVPSNHCWLNPGVKVESTCALPDSVYTDITTTSQTWNPIAARMSAALLQSSASLLSHYQPSIWDELNPKYIFTRSVLYALLNPIQWPLRMLAGQSCDKFVRLVALVWRNHLAFLCSYICLITTSTTHHCIPPLQWDIAVRVIGVNPVGLLCTT